jgi:hypothetical protein
VILTIPFAAILVVLRPYLWPLDNAPTSYFSDIHHQHGPSLKLLAHGLRHDGELPRWNPQDFAGTPTVGDPQAGVYNPVYWLLLLRPTLNSIGLMVFAYALFGALGFILYARALGFSPAGAAAGAVAFVLGGKLLLHLVLPGHSVKAPFFLVPLILWAMQRAADRPGPRRVATAAALTALLVASLHPQVLFYTTWLLVAVGVTTAHHASQRSRAFAALAAAGLLTLALTAVHVLPFLGLATEFSRAHPELYDVARWDRENPGASAHWHELVTGTSASWEGHYYFGGVTLWFSIAGLFAWSRGDPRRRLAWLYGLWALVLLLYGLGSEGGIQPLLARLPGFGHFRLPARALVVLGLPVAMLTCLGVEALTRAPARRQWLTAGGACLIVLALLLATAAEGWHFSVFALAIGGATILGASRRGERATPEDLTASPPARTAVGPLAFTGAVTLVVALAIDTGGMITPWVQTAPEEQSDRLAPGVTLPSDMSSVLRIAETSRDTVSPGIPELARRRYRLETLAGYNSLVPWRFLLYACYASGYSPLDFNIGDAVPIHRHRPKLFDLLGVTHFLHQDEAGGKNRWRWEQSTTALPRAYLVPGPIVVPEGQGDEAIWLEGRALVRLDRIDPRRQVLLHGAEAATALDAIGASRGIALEPFRSVAVSAHTANRVTLEVTTERPGILVMNEPFFRGWQAWDRGVPLRILRANVLFRALALPPGNHQILLEFSPASWRVGWWISVAGLAATIGLSVPMRRSK